MESQRLVDKSVVGRNGKNIGRAGLHAARGAMKVEDSLLQVLVDDGLECGLNGRGSGYSA